MKPIPIRNDNTPQYVRDIAEGVGRVFDYFRPNFTSITDDYEISTASECLLVDATAGDIDITLPFAKPYARAVVMVVRTDSSGNAVTVNAQSGEEVNGASSITVPASYGAFIFTSNGVAWVNISSSVIASGSGTVDSVYGRTGAVVALAGDYTATKITNTPSGSIASTNVQAALNELDTEKAAVSHTHAASAIVSGTIDTARLGSGTANDTTFLRGDQTWAVAATVTGTLVLGGLTSSNLNVAQPVLGGLSSADI